MLQLRKHSHGRQSAQYYKIEHYNGRQSTRYYKIEHYNGRQSTSAICASIVTADRVPDAIGWSTITADRVRDATGWNTLTADKVPATTAETFRRPKKYFRNLRKHRDGRQSTLYHLASELSFVTQLFPFGRIYLEAIT